jgi:hypothetical protein
VSDTPKFSFSDYVQKHRTREQCDGFPGILPRIVCADGLSLSVQGNEGAYCAPRINDLWYYQVEVGYPSEMIPELMEYAETPEDPTGTVYGYVPVGIVERIIDAHGGAA